MNKSNHPARIHLVVSNPESLEFGTRPTQAFDETGGTIGSRGANWLLTESNDGVAPIHAEVTLVDGAFCVVDRCGQTWINDAVDPLGKERIVSLNEGDVLRIGPYRIIANLEDTAHALIDPTRHLGQQSLAEIMNERDSSLVLLSAPDSSTPDLAGYANQQDALSAFIQPLGEHDGVEPLAALEAAERKLEARAAASVALDRTHYGLSGRQVVQPDLAMTNVEAVSNINLKRGAATTMDKDSRFAPTHSAHSGGAYAGAEGSRMAMIPLGQGMGLELGHLDSAQAQELLLEVGLTLKATVEGITALFAAVPDGQRRPNLLGRTLQPIEDNPLRLGLPYQETMETLFTGQRSPVHLSPRAAVGEGLEQVAKHNAAIVDAVSEALQALLRAFSPQALQQRFERYAGEGQAAQDQGWLWTMYGHYFEELVSSRQHGFDKLFWEVFEQAYDRALRRGE